MSRVQKRARLNLMAHYHYFLYAHSSPCVCPTKYPLRISHNTCPGSWFFALEPQRAIPSHSALSSPSADTM